MVDYFANAESCFTKDGRLLRVPNAFELRILVAILVLGRMLNLFVAQCAGSEGYGASWEA